MTKENEHIHSFVQGHAHILLSFHKKLVWKIDEVFL